MYDDEFELTFNLQDEGAAPVELPKAAEEAGPEAPAETREPAADEGTDQLDKNVTKDGNKKEETTVVYDTGDTRQPYVICRQMPKIEGVVVVAQGGGNAKTVTEISNAVMSLFPVEAHKVVVVKMSVQEE